MLCILNFRLGKAKAYYVGENISPNMDWNPDMMVQADCTELTVIRAHMKDLRDTGKRVVTFVGDDARFIIANWNAIAA